MKTIKKAKSRDFAFLAVTSAMLSRPVMCSGYKSGYNYLTSLCGDLLLSVEELTPKLEQNNQICSLAKSHFIYGIGPCLTGLLFETTAIHEIRSQRLADVLIK